ncbi:MAG: M64 family metallo-endopeptidase [Verrucomicrobia bacterium]|nr:M64 family metallo-endopeptidase [Verrucomicrobiota bacterium]
MSRKSSIVGIRGLGWQWLLCGSLMLAMFSFPSCAWAAYVTMVDNGPSANRVNAVFLGDGYTASQISSTYVTHINNLVNYMFNPGGSTLKVDPFARYKNFFDIYRVDVISNQSGADDPINNIYVDTALDASYRFDGVTDRLLGVNGTKANTALNSGIGGAFTVGMKFVTVNATKYGGAGGTYATYAGGNSSALEIALHESGHSFDRLGDEYGGNTGTYAGSEPSQVNITKDPTGAKWSRWIGYDQPGVGVIGAYEGGYYYDHGIYRPSLNSKMRSLNQPFDAVAREKIILDIYSIVDPVDSYLANTSTLTDPNSLWVSVIDTDVISLQWYCDDTPITGATNEVLDLTMGSYSQGLHTFKALAYDPTDWVRADRSSLQQTLSWSAMLVPEPGVFALVSTGLMICCWCRRAKKTK